MRRNKINIPIATFQSDNYYLNNFIYYEDNGKYIFFCRIQRNPSGLHFGIYLRKKPK